MSESPGAPDVQRVGDTLRLTWPPMGVQIDMDRFTETKEGVYAEILVAHLVGDGKPSLLHASRLNLLAAQSRASAVKGLGERGLAVPWAAMIEAACFLGVQRWRDGEPTVDLREVDPYQRPRWLLRPYIEHGGPTVLFAPGGTGKTYLACAMAVAVAAGERIVGVPQGAAAPVLILDWETDHFTHAERLQALCAGANLGERPPVYYRHMVAPLTDAVSAVRREVARLKVGLVVYDSLGLACGGDLESAETIIRTFGAIRSVEAPALVVSHVTKAVMREGAAPSGGRLSPFGSIYTENQARNTWSLQRAGEEGEEESAVALVHEKTNNGRFQKRHAYRLSFVNDADDAGDDHLVSVEVRPCDLTQIAEFAQKLPLRERIMTQLRQGAVLMAALCEQLPGADKQQVMSRLNELKRQGVVVRLDDQRWGLGYAAGPAVAGGAGGY